MKSNFYRFLLLLSLFISSTLLQSCNKEEPYEIQGVNGFYVQENSGFTNEPITITIFDRDDTEVAKGVISKFTDTPDLGICETVVNDYYYSIQLPDGVYYAYIIEGDKGSQKGAWFNDQDGLKLIFSAGQCMKYSIGSTLEARENPNQ